MGKWKEGAGSSPQGGEALVSGVTRSPGEEEGA